MILKKLAQVLLPPILAAPLQRLGLAVQAAVARRRLADCDRLHLGCGSNVLDGWGNVCLAGPRAVVKLDLTRPLPVNDESIRFIFNEHFIEHITRLEAAAFLAECRRVLAPGGIIRLSTPSLEGVVASYTGSDDDPETPCRLINNRMRHWGHQFLYDRPELEELLLSAGFSRITTVAWHESAHPPLSDLECRPDHGELIIEAEK